MKVFVESWLFTRTMSCADLVVSSVLTDFICFFAFSVICFLTPCKAVWEIKAESRHSFRIERINSGDIITIHFSSQQISSAVSIVSQYSRRGRLFAVTFRSRIFSAWLMIVNSMPQNNLDIIRKNRANNAHALAPRLHESFHVRILMELACATCSIFLFIKCFLIYFAINCPKSPAIRFVCSYAIASFLNAQ